MVESLQPRPAPSRSRWTIPGVLAAVAVISLLHYLTPPAHEQWHVVYQRLYYIPILIGAVLYGMRGGLAVAVLTSVSYLPHILLHWQHDPLYRSNQLAEIVLFLIFGAISGFLIDRVNGEREHHRRTAEALARSNEQLRSTYQRLRLLDRLSSLGAISAGLAHEIRNPLGGVSGAVEILDSLTAPGDERREFVDIVRKEIGRLSSIVSRQLELVATDRPERVPCDVAKICRSVVDLVRKQADSQGIVVAAEIAEGLPVLEADEQGLRQAILNLLINSIQAMPDGGTARIRVSARRDGVRIVVEDEGPGFSEQALEYAFHPFFSTKNGGTGLGLSIAFQIVDQQGGDLRVENRRSAGARLTMDLPSTPAPADSRGTLQPLGATP